MDALPRGVKQHVDCVSPTQKFLTAGERGALN
jgi:hypothetical protein